MLIGLLSISSKSSLFYSTSLTPSENFNFALSDILNYFLKAFSICFLMKPLLATSFFLFSYDFSISTLLFIFNSYLTSDIDAIKLLNTYECNSFVSSVSV